MAFYTFVRAADDVADAPGLDDQEKRDILSLWRRQLTEGGDDLCRPLNELRHSLAQTAVSPQHARDLLSAFLRDVDHPCTQSWDDLMGYCRLSAMPVGRYLIDLLDGPQMQDENRYAASDALCAALQILNHLQDLRDDYTLLKRVYVPADWMAQAGVREADLGASGVSPELRGVIDRMIDGVDDLLMQAKPLPGSIRNKALAREAGGILAIARRLSKALRANDPLAGRVALSKPHAALWFLWGALTA